MSGSKGYSGGIENVTNVKDLPTMRNPGKPNTEYRYYQNGKLKSVRITNANGVPVKSIHYTDHGNPKIHPQVPHTHDWEWINGQWTESSDWY